MALQFSAVTRAESLVVLVGSRRAIGIAVRNNTIARRNTRLVDRLSECGDGDAEPDTGKDAGLYAARTPRLFGD